MGFCGFPYCISVLFMWYLMLFRTINITATSFIYKETSKPFVFSQLFPLRSVSMGSARLVTSSQSVTPPTLTTSNTLSDIFLFQECLLPIHIIADFSFTFPAHAPKALLACAFCIDQCHQWVGYTLVSGKDYKGAILSSVTPKAVRCISSEKSVCDLQLNISTIGS